METPSVFGFKCEGRYITQMMPYDNYGDLGYAVERFFKLIEYEKGWNQLKQNCHKLKIIPKDDEDILYGDLTESPLGRSVSYNNLVDHWMGGIYTGEIQETSNYCEASRGWGEVAFVYILDLDEHAFKIFLPNYDWNTKSCNFSIVVSRDLRNPPTGPDRFLWPNWELELIQKTNPEYYDEIIERVRGIERVRKKEEELKKKSELDVGFIIESLEKVEESPESSYEIFDDMFKVAIKKDEWSEELFSAFMNVLDLLPNWYKREAFNSLIKVVRNPELKVKITPLIKNKFLQLLKSFQKVRSFGFEDRLGPYDDLLNTAVYLGLLAEYYPIFLRYLDTVFTCKYKFTDERKEEKLQALTSLIHYVQEAKILKEEVKMLKLEAKTLEENIKESKYKKKWRITY